MESSDSNTPPERRTLWTDRAVVLSLGVVAALIRLTGLPDLTDNDQSLTASYAADILADGNWAIQTNEAGEFATKPPLFQWIVSLLAIVTGGGLNRAILIAPSILGITGSAMIAHEVARRWFGREPAFYAALMVIASSFGLKYIGLIRVDALFALLVTISALLAWKSWQSGSGWIWFWTVAALATLTKTPLAVPVALAGLAAVPWCRKPALPVLKGLIHPPGPAVFLLLTGGWLFWVWRDAGRPALDRLIVDELVGHVVSAGNRGYFGRGFTRAPEYFLSRFAPWCLVLLVALWRVFRHPSGDDLDRRRERFLAAGVVGGFLLFCLAAKPRPDHLLPLIPFSAVLAGRELGRWLAPWPVKWKQAGFVVVVSAAFIGTWLQYHRFYRSDARVSYTIALRDLAGRVQAVRAPTPSGIPVFYTFDAPFALPYYAEQYNRLSIEEVAELLRSNREDAILAVVNVESVKRSLEQRGEPLSWRILAEVPMPDPFPPVHLFTNCDSMTLPEKGTLRRSGLDGK